MSCCHFDFLLTCVLVLLLPDCSSTPVSHQPLQNTCTHPLVSLVCIEACVVPSLLVGLSVFGHAAPVRLCLFPGPDLFLVVFWIVLCFSITLGIFLAQYFCCLFLLPALIPLNSDL